MKKKPVVCLIDEDPVVEKGWARSLGAEASLKCYRDPAHLVRAGKKDRELYAGFSCVIMGRYFRNSGFDVISSDIPNLLRAELTAPLFLNWQGYVTKEELNSKFDGKLFHRYGVKWQTLRLRIQKFERLVKEKSILDTPVPQKAIALDKMRTRSRKERCESLLQNMAHKASGNHRQKLEYLAVSDLPSGVTLLESLYQRLMTTKEVEPGCPSEYIASSPVIARRILQEALND